MSKKAYRLRLCVLLAVSLFFIVGYYYYKICSQIPDRMTIEAGSDTSLAVNTPSVTVESDSALKDSKVGTYKVHYKLLGLMELKNVRVDVVEGMHVYAGGFPVGIYVQTDGILVIGCGNVTGLDGEKYAPAEHVMQSGDYITAINGTAVTTKEAFIKTVNEQGENPVVLDIVRNGEKSSVKLTPVKTGGSEYRLGIWIRDNTQGVGMLTYMTKEGAFGALGHGITDVDTGGLMEIEEGRILDTEIVSIVKGKDGDPGELVGMIDYNREHRLGMVTKNTASGIFGKIDENALCNMNNELMKVGWKQEMHTGKAYIRTCVDGEVKDYEAKILDIDMSSEEENKSFLLEVTDKELIQKTGGIVQGMSGSPVIQDGKLVGAVTHVLVKDSTRGYGIFIENMLQKSK